MEDFGFNLQNIKNNKNDNTKGIIRIILIILSIVIFSILIVKIIKFSSNNNENSAENVILIKSPVKEIKKYSEKESGLDVSNRNVSVYDVIDNNQDLNAEPIIKKTVQTLNIDNDTMDATGTLNHEQNLLRQKINEISNDDELKISLENDDMDKSQTNDTSKINININSDKKSETNINDLEKLGNKSLIKNLKAKKDTKPGIKVQLLALKSRDGLIKYWNEISEKYPNIFKDKSYYIEQVNYNRPDSVYRLHVGNFDSEDSASVFCREYITLTNKNKIDCIVVKENK